MQMNSLYYFFFEIVKQATIPCSSETKIHIIGRINRYTVEYPYTFGMRQRYQISLIFLWYPFWFWDINRIQHVIHILIWKELSRLYFDPIAPYKRNRHQLNHTTAISKSLCLIHLLNMLD
jgi:hypothetical protein